MSPEQPATAEARRGERSHCRTQYYTPESEKAGFWSTNLGGAIRTEISPHCWLCRCMRVFFVANPIARHPNPYVPSIYSHEPKANIPHSTPGISKFSVNHQHCLIHYQVRFLFEHSFKYILDSNLPSFVPVITRTPARKSRSWPIPFMLLTSDLSRAITTSIISDSTIPFRFQAKDPFLPPTKSFRRTVEI